LVFEVFGVGEGGVIEYENVRKGGTNKINDEAEDPENISGSSLCKGQKGVPGDEIQSQCLPVDVVPRPCAHICPL